eukprot:TRINITY_DN1513_c0_g5_i2.p1 TRINITY_DN1513_c0_g5~~TRINITY_DN1513_c0_g5_i2.p1  ORF type:complete len:378 (+),score=31.65 TRINITY_DN1513_c0_g5_i2:93-1226(+)
MGCERPVRFPWSRSTDTSVPQSPCRHTSKSPMCSSAEVSSYPKSPVPPNSSASPFKMDQTAALRCFRCRDQVICVQALGNYKTQANLALASIGTERLVDFKFSKNSDSILYALSNGSNVYTWQFEGDDNPLKVERVGLLNAEVKAPTMIVPHDYVKDLLYVVGDKNKLVACNNSLHKAVETRSLLEMDKLCSVAIPRSELAAVIVGDTLGRVAGIDGRIGREGAVFSLVSHLHATQVVEMCKYGSARLAVYGIELMSRKVKIFDIKNLKEPVQVIAIDSMKSEPLLPHFDEDTGVCFAAGNKAEKIYVHIFNEAGQLKEVLPLPLKEQVVSLGAMPKAVVDVKNVEILRMLTLNKDKTVKVISIKAPKKNVASPITV